MAQTNVIVTYATARQPAPTISVRENALGQRRWSATLAGALLAGGAVFVLGQFVTPDGSLRETGFLTRPSVPKPEAESVRAAPAAPPARVERQVAVESTPLPYLALVRDIAPRPAAARPATRPLSAPEVRAKPVADISAPRPAPEAPRAGGPELVADLAPQSLPPPASGLRRDLEGFLQTQGHELALPDAPATLIASAGGFPLAPPTSMQPAEIDKVEPPGTPTDAVVTLAEVREPPRPGLGAADTERLAERPPPPGAEPSAALDRAAPDAATAHIAVGPAANADVATPSTPTQASAQSYPLAVVNGEPLGAITLRGGGASEPAIHLGTLVGLLRLRMPEAQFAWLSGAAAADRFVTLNELRAAGIVVQFDPRQNQLLIEAR